MGPLALMDLIGLDTAYEILDSMYKQGRDRLHAPSPIIKQMVTAGLKGRKSGRGFYSYEEPGSSTVVADDLTPAAGAAAADGLRTVASVGVIVTSMTFGGSLTPRPAARRRCHVTRTCATPSLDCRTCPFVRQAATASVGT